MNTARPTSKSPLATACRAVAVATAGLPAYSSARSRHDYTQPQLFAALAMKQFFKTDDRGIVAILADSTDLRAAIGLAKVPHCSTRPGWTAGTPPGTTSPGRGMSGSPDWRGRS